MEGEESALIHRHVFHNDSLLPIEKVRLSPGQAGLICGWGLFTTVRISRGEAFAYERHWRRLEKDAALIRLPMLYTAAKVRVHLHEVIRANNVTEGSARIYLVYNQVGFWRSDEPQPQVDLIIYSAPLPEYREPVRLGLRPHGRHAAAPLAGVTVSRIPLTSVCVSALALARVASACLTLRRVAAAPLTLAGVSRVCVSLTLARVPAVALGLGLVPIAVIALCGVPAGRLRLA